MAIKDVYQAVMEFRQAEVPELVQKELDQGAEVQTILNEGLIAPMDEVGAKFASGDMFIPEMLQAAQAMKSGLEVLRPLMTESDSKPVATVVVGTVKGDLHDIGKNLVSMMLEGAGFKVIDLGVDISPDKLAEAVRQNQAELVGLSALLSTTMPAMGEAVEYLKNQSLEAKIMVGGAPVTQEFADQIGAHGYAEDAPSAVALARSLT